MKAFLLAIAAISLFGFAVVVWAQEQTATVSPKAVQPTKATPTAKIPVLRGEFVSIDTTTNMITVKKSGKDESFATEPNVMVKKAGKVIALKDLTPNEKVDLRYKTEAGKKVVTQISVVVPKAKQPTTQSQGTQAPPK